MNSEQPRSVTLAARLKRAAVAGGISTLIYLVWSSTFLIFLSPDVSPGRLGSGSILYWTYWSLLMFSMPGFMFGLYASDAIHHPGAGFLLAIVTSLVFWFCLGAIPAGIFRRNRLVVIVWIVLAIIVDLLGWKMFTIITKDLVI